MTIFSIICIFSSKTKKYLNAHNSVVGELLILEYNNMKLERKILKNAIVNNY